MGWFTRRPQDNERLLDQLDAELQRRVPDAESASGNGTTDAAAADTSRPEPENNCDVASVPDTVEDGPARPTMLDFGPLQLPLVEGAQIQPVADQNMCESLTVLIENWQLNVAVIAAPRSGNWWQRHVERMIEAAPDAYQTVTTAHGPELLTQSEDGGLPLRIVGVDGPGWTLRVTYIGRIAHDVQLRKHAETWLEGIEVKRPDGVFLPGELIPLDLGPLLGFLEATGQKPDGDTSA